MMRLVGVTWGKTIARVVDGLRQLNPQPPALPAPVRFVPLTGEPLTYPDPETSSSNLAHWLNDIVNQDSYMEMRAGGPFLADLSNGEQAFPGSGHQTPPEEEIRHLKRENEVLRQERDI